MGDLDDALALSALASGDFGARADARYEAGSGMFGGWTAAMLLQSVSRNPHAQGTPSTLTVHYVKRIEPGAAITLRARPSGATRSLAIWQAALHLEDDEHPAAIATVLLATRRTSDAFTEPSMPAAPDPDSLRTLHPPGAFGERTILRPVTGDPSFGRGDTRSLSWTKEASGRAIDYLQLAYLADAYAPRIFFRSQGFRPSSTITMSIYFHATEDELRPLGDDYVLTEAWGTRAESSTIGSQARLWSRQGQLLATTEQLCWFK